MRVLSRVLSFVVDYFVAPVLLIVMAPVFLAGMTLVVSGGALIAVFDIAFRTLEIVVDFMEKIVKKENEKCNQANLE